MFMNTYRTPALAAVLLALAGCAAMQPQTPEQVVQERAQARWDALIKGDFEKAWTYTDAQTRSQVAQQDYKQRFGAAGAWISATVLRVECQPEKCLAAVRLTTQNIVPNFAQAIPQITTFVDEEWVRDEGQWWYARIDTGPKPSQILPGAAESENQPDAPKAPRQGE